MTIEEFEREQAELFAKEAQERMEREKVYVETKCKELGCSRLARCQDCGKIVATDPNLPFFEAKPDKDYDTYYCGCYGWD